MHSAPEHPWASHASALLATLFWGLSFVALRIALEELEPFGLVWLRNAIGAFVLFGILRARGVSPWPQRADLTRCTLLGLILGLHLLVQTFALGMTSAIRAGWIIAFIPAVVALLAVVFLRQRLAAQGWLGIVLATSGVLVLTSVRPATFARAGQGDLLMLSTCFSWAAYTLLSVGPTRRNGSLRVSAFSMLVASVPNLIAAGFTGTWREPPTARTLGALFFLGVLSSAIAFWAFNRAVADLGPERGAAFQYLQPFVTLCGAWLILGEPLTAGVLLGGPLVLLGVWWIQRSKSVRLDPVGVEGVASR
jgi:drug/metabolite transporter (DMT)-like permease